MRGGGSTQGLGFRVFRVFGVLKAFRVYRVFRYLGYVGKLGFRVFKVPGSGVRLRAILNSTTTDC